MSMTIRRLDLQRQLTFFFVVVAAAALAAPASASGSRKLDESSTPAAPGTDVKCGSCTENPPPPPSPPPPCPPPPSLPPPPPPPKKPPTQNCPPPPPSPAYIYVTGAPGNLYPVEPYFSGAGRNVVAGLAAMVCSGLLGLLTFW